jgi:hypothetical protein
MKAAFIDLPLPEGRTMTCEPFGIVVMSGREPNQSYVYPFGHPDGFFVTMSREDVMKLVNEAREKAGA